MQIVSLDFSVNARNDHQMINPVASGLPPTRDLEAPTPGVSGGVNFDLALQETTKIGTVDDPRSKQVVSPAEIKALLHLLVTGGEGLTVVGGAAFGGLVGQAAGEAALLQRLGIGFADARIESYHRVEKSGVYLLRDTGADGREITRKVQMKAGDYLVTYSRGIYDGFQFRGERFGWAVMSPVMGGFLSGIGSPIKDKGEIRGR